jgi:GNAT superfamily N-acetyltransferase
MLMKGLVHMNNQHQLNQDALIIRNAVITDAKVILDFIKALAVYEHLEDRVTATVERITDSLFKRKDAEVIIGEFQGKAVAFALFFHNYSTFLGQANLFLEDLYVHEGYRGLGFGQQMLSHVASIAVDRGCARLDWWCLDWNTSAIEFYKRSGAIHLKDWTVFRVQDDALKHLAKHNQKG